MSSIMDASLSRSSLQNNIGDEFFERQAQIEKQAVLCISRLERLSVDSIWAHRASGVRGALLKLLDEFQVTSVLPGGASPELLERLEINTSWGFWLLEQAAIEMLR